MSSQGPATVHYEVYILQDRRWVLHARYDRDERETAIEDAKTVERTLAIAAKVVRDTYYPGNNVSEEAVVYAGNKTLRDRAATATATPTYRAGGAVRRGGGAGGGSAQPFTIPASIKGRNGPAGPSKPAGVLFKLLLIIAASLSGSGALTGLLSSMANRLPDMGIQISPQMLSFLLFVAFITIFLSVAVPLAMRLINWDDMPSGKGSAKAKAPAAPRPVKPASAPSAAKDDKKDIPDEPFPADDQLEEVEDEDLDWSGLDDSQALTELLPPIPALPPQEIAAEEAAPTPEAENQAAKNEAGKDGGKKDKDEAKKDDPSLPPEAEDKDGLEEYRRSMMRFLSTLLSAIKRFRPHLDAYNKFGLDLMLAGGVDVVGSHAHLSADDKRIVLKDTIEVMGTRPESAKAFADRHEDYLMEPRYMAMVQMGRSAMEAMLAGQDIAIEDLSGIFDSWNKPQSAQNQRRIMTILFTDMVGSTDMTQSRGDQAAQDVVRRHNSIVRQALAENGGKEVKHTGDGIMASFGSATNGVDAAIAIQRAVARHNEKSPGLQLQLRIGINAGEPIEEEDDLFGTTVQLAARVCAAADANQILCTNVVRELAAGKNRDFTAKGPHALKGFKDRVALFAVEWAEPGEPSPDAEPDE